MFLLPPENLMDAVFELGSLNQGHSGPSCVGVCIVSSPAQILRSEWLHVFLCGSATMWLLVQDVTPPLLQDGWDWLVSKVIIIGELDFQNMNWPDGQYV